MIQSVMTMAPLRISLSGGGTDLPAFFTREEGSVTSFAINKYTYVHVKRHDPLFQERFRISYSDTEHCNDIAEIRNDVIRSCLEYLHFDQPLHISTSADLPSRSGLGSSSSLMVALLHALHEMNGEEVSPIQLAEESFEIENTILKSEVGKQDQYASAFGGINHFIFSPNGRVKCEPIVVSKLVQNYFRNSLLLWTEVQRPANEILTEQVKELASKIDYYRKLKVLADQIADAMTSDALSIHEVTRLVRQGWDLKRSLSQDISSAQVELISNHLDELHLPGHKLLGAGAGGFFLVLEASSRIEQLQKFYKILNFEIDQKGSRIIHVIS